MKARTYPRIGAEFLAWFLVGMALAHAAKIYLLPLIPKPQPPLITELPMQLVIPTYRMECYRVPLSPTPELTT